MKGVVFLAVAVLVAVWGYVLLGDNVWVVAIPVAFIGFCGAGMVYQGDEPEEGPVVEYVKRD